MAQRVVRFGWGLLLLSCILIAQSPVPPDSTKNSITFENPSSTDVVIKLVGPSPQTGSIAVGKSATMSIAAGEYSILIRYGSSPSDYVYTKAGPLQITETASQHSA